MSFALANDKWDERNSDYKVKDIGLAEWGRREIEIAEQEIKKSALPH